MPIAIVHTLFAAAVLTCVFRVTFTSPFIANSMVTAAVDAARYVARESCEPFLTIASPTYTLPLPVAVAHTRRSVTC